MRASHLDFGILRHGCLMQAINIAGPIAGGFAVSLLTKDDIKGW